MRASSDEALAAFAPAKVNLTLHVLGRRTDGYHEIESLVVFADVVAIAVSMCLAAWVRDRLVTRPEALGPMVKTGVASLEKGLCIGIFPEGQVARDKKLQPPQGGALFLRRVDIFIFQSANPAR